MTTHYTTFQIISIFGTAAIAVAAIIYLHILRKYKTAVLLLFIAAALIRFSVIRFDQFVNLWDEQFHALVAKNMMDEPFKPMLYKDPVLPYNKAMWISSHVWLHKPPLFLWQIALSMKLFGVNEFGLRFPGAFMSFLFVLMIYSMARKWTNRYIAFYAALISAFSSYLLVMVAGFQPTDHNDTAFIFYVTASLWAWTKYMYSGKLKWVILAGVIAGCAVLVKWYAGLLIFPVWGIAVLSSAELRKTLRSYIHIVISFVLCILVFLPWQIYVAIQFPAENKFSSLAKAEHLWNVVEGHGGGLLYHFFVLDTLYAKGAVFLTIPALLLLVRKIRNKGVKVASVAFVLIPFLVFSVSATKLSAFTMISSSVIFIAFATLIYELFLFFRPRYQKHRKFGKFIAVAALIGCLFWFYNVDHIQYHHTVWKNEKAEYRNNRYQSAAFFRSMDVKAVPEHSIFINCKAYDAVMMMFYTPFVAYDGIPYDDQMQILMNSGRPVFVFENDETEALSEQYPWLKIYSGDYW